MNPVTSINFQNRQFKPEDVLQLSIFASDLPPSSLLSALHCVDRPVSPCDKSIASAAESLIVSNYFLRSTLVVMAWLRGAKSGASQLRELDKTLLSW